MEKTKQNFFKIVASEWNDFGRWIQAKYCRYELLKIPQATLQTNAQWFPNRIGMVLSFHQICRANLHDPSLQVKLVSSDTWITVTVWTWACSSDPQKLSSCVSTCFWIKSNTLSYESTLLVAHANVLEFKEVDIEWIHQLTCALSGGAETVLKGLQKK